MASFELYTQILASPEIVFKLSCSIDLHKISVQQTNEEAVAGTTTGLIKQGETVTWKARHLFKTRYHQSLIKDYIPYQHFKDVMLKGEFKRFEHAHYFESMHGGCLMTDKLILEAPYGFWGKLLVRLFLKKYMIGFIVKRNAVIKDFAESDKWKLILPHA